MKNSRKVMLGLAATVGTIASITESVPKIIDAGTSAFVWFLNDEASIRPDAVDTAGMVEPKSVLFELNSAMRDIGARPSCEALWLERNQIFNLHGLCFRSPLGQAIYDNSDCSSAELRLASVDNERVTAIAAQEANYGCEVDTSRMSVAVVTADGEVTFGRGGLSFVGSSVVDDGMAETTLVESIED